MTAERLDLGRIRVQEAFPWTVKITNPGRGAVQVYDLMSSCSCTKIDPLSFVVPPKGSVDVSLTIDLTTTDPEQAARAERPFNVELSPLIAVPEGMTRLTWNLHGTVASAIALEPPQVVFPETLIRGLPWESKSITVRSLEPVESVTAQCDPAQANVEVLAVDGATDSCELRITPSQSLPAGVRKLTFAIQATLADGEAAPPVPLGVFVNVVEDLQFEPTLVALSTRLEGESVTLRSRTGQSFRVVEVTPLEAEALEVVSIDPAAEPSSVSNWLVSLTDEARRAGSLNTGETRQIKVRFRVRYQDGREAALTLPVQRLTQ